MALIGIDLGTTNSLVAYFRDGRPHLIPNSLGSYLTPSCVGLLEDGRIVVGEMARELSVMHPERCASRFKRLMGTDQTEQLHDQIFTAPQLSSLVLTELRESAERELGEPVTGAVITVPAYFNEHQRKATQAAALIAGLTASRIINEPTAAALAYGLDDPTAEKKVLVFDLGGGTFDVTLMDLFEGTMEIVATAGESFLGGEDFTQALVGQVLEAQGLQFEHEEMVNPARIARMLKDAEWAKRQFAEQSSVTLRIPSTDGALENAREVVLTREAWLERVKPLNDRLHGPVRKVLRDSRLDPDGVDEIILVGGATRMRFVPDLLRDIFVKTPIRDYQPDHAVALGAAVQAAMIERDVAVEDLVMTDVCPHTLGIAIVRRLGNQFKEGYFMPVIHRNTTIPVSREEAVCTVAPGQTELAVKVFQGEARRVDDNLPIGELVVKGLPPAPPGLEVLIRFTYDANGLLDVIAIVPSTGLRRSCVLDTGLKSLNAEEFEAAKSQLRSLRYFPRDDARNQHLLLVAERVMPELAPWQREEFEQIVGSFEQALHAQDREYVESSRALLVKVLTQLGVDLEDGASPEAGSQFQ